jgi:hypothetical protein
LAFFCSAPGGIALSLYNLLTVLPQEGTQMKCIDAIIRPNSLDAVKDSPVSIGVDVTVAEVRDFGQQKRHSEVYRGAD